MMFCTKKIWRCMACVTVALLVVSCGSKKIVVPGGNVDYGTTGITRQQVLKHVVDNQVTAANIVADMNLNLKTGDKSVSLPGSIHMRKDEVIRLQVFMPLLGTELGRVEFAPEYVLVIDRMHKQYVKGDYNQLDFLRKNGLTFYSLQALFWNQLFLPGEKKLADRSMNKFSVEVNADSQTLPVAYSQDKLAFTWDVTKASMQIEKAMVEYNGGQSVLLWNYSNFKSLGAKRFPAHQSFTFNSSALDGKTKTATITLKMSDVTTDSKWDTQSTVSSKYKKVEGDSLLKLLLGAGGLKF